MLPIELEGVESFLIDLSEIQSHKKEWQRYTDLEHEKVYYRQDKGTKFHTTYIETLVKAPMLDVISVLSEVSSYKDWVSVITHSELLSEASCLRKLSCIRADLPKPMAKRQLIVQASGHMIPKENAIVITMQSVSPGSKWLKDFTIPKTLKSTRYLVNMEVPKSFVYVKSLAPGKTQVKLLLSGDPRLDFVPQTLINWTIKSVVMTFIN